MPLIPLFLVVLIFDAASSVEKGIAPLDTIQIVASQARIQVDNSPNNYVSPPAMVYPITIYILDNRCFHFMGSSVLARR